MLRNDRMNIIAIETSCDETAVALLQSTATGLSVVKNIVSSQIDLHKQYGGVVPEIAARAHSETLVPLLQKQIGLKTLKSADLIAVTAGPGLITSLMIGVQAAKTLSFMLQKPLVGINHLEGHIYANWLPHRDGSRNKQVQALFQKPKQFFPALALVVSGGHTEFVMIRNHGDYKLLGQTVDDAAGESFDKVSKILGLGYPGGPIISTLAVKGNPKAIDFPRPMLASKDYNMSFSGLKTAVLYYLEKKKNVKKSEIPDVVASFQQAVIDVLIAKMQKAIAEHRPRSLMMGGGVSANPALREAVMALGGKNTIPVFIPDLQYTGDNAAMIGAVAYFRRKEASKTLWKTLAFNPQWYTMR